MKKIFRLTALAVIISLLAACTAVETNAPAQHEKVTISIGEWPADDRPIEKLDCNKQEEEFEKKYPYIEIIPDDWAYDIQTFLPKAASGQLPTLYKCHLTETRKIINAGYSADITDILKKLGYVEYFNKDILSLCQKDGRYYGVPEGYYRMGLACNVELFGEAGLLDDGGVPVFPNTWEELAKIASLIKQRTGKAGFIMPTINNIGGWHFTNIAWSFGVEFMRQEEDGWKATFDTPECVKALQYIKDLKWKYDALPDNIFIDQPEMQKLFALDQGAMYLTAYADVQLTEKYGMNINRFSMTKVPKGSAGRFSLMGGKTYMFSPEATTEEIEACFKWLEFTKDYRPMLTEEEQSKYLETYKGTMKKKVDDNFVVYDPGTGIWDIPELQEKINNIRNEATNINPKMVEKYQDWTDVTVRPEEPMCCQELYAVLDSCIQAVLADENADPAALIKKANEDFQKNHLDKIE